MEEKKKIKKAAPKTNKVGDKLLNAKEFSTLAQLNVRTSFWVTKKFGSEKISGFEWSDRMIAEKVLDDTPEIFNLKSNGH